MKTQNKSICAVPFLLFLTACGGGGDGGGPNPPPPTNIAPTAIVAADFSIDEKSNVSLDGSASNDPDGSITSYAWTQISGVSVTLSGENTAVASFTAPDVDSDAELRFQLTVTDNDGATHSDTMNVTLKHIPENQAPTAVAGDDFSANENTSVTLNGNSSSDPDGSIVEYSWTQVSGPGVVINDANQATATFTAPDVGSDSQFSFQLTVTDDDGVTHSDTLVITITDITVTNQAPVAVAADDFHADENTTVSLDGSASYDPDGSISSYSWTQVTGPTVAISGTNQAIASFTAPDVAANTLFGFRLTVTDNNGATHSDILNVTIHHIAGNIGPTAIAGSNFSANENTTVSLNGSASFDSDGSISSYSWTQISGSPNVTINNRNSVNASFTAPDVTSSTSLRFQLRVVDNDGAEDTDTVTVTINPVTVPNLNDEIARGASRTSGVAPLSVFFTAGFANGSASNRDFDELEYAWDFDDLPSGNWATTGQSKNEAKGPVASHVFESAGTYHVELTVRNASGIIDSETITITVSDPDAHFPGTNTTCFSDTSNNNFSGCPAGATQVTTDDISEIANYVGSHRRVLLQRGSAWARSGRIDFPANLTTLHIGAYGNCQSPSAQGICSNAPQINMSGSSEFIVVDRSRDWRLTDIRFTGEASNFGIISGSVDIRRLLLLRIQTTGFYDSIIWGNWRGSDSDRIAENSVVSCNISDTERYATIIGGEQLTYMGNIAADSTTYHITRIWFSYQGVISHNILSGASYTNSSGLHALKFHGPSESQVGSYAQTGSGGMHHRSKFTLIANNLFGSSGPWPVSIGPQNSTSNENLSDLIIEKNRFIAAYGSQSPRPVNTGLMFGGRYVTVRNNIFDGSGNTEGYRGVVIERRGIENTPLGNRIYNNTIYKDGTSVWPYEGVVVDSTASDTIIRNNFVSFPVANNKELITDYSGNATVSHNLLVDNHGFVDATNNNPLRRNFSLTASSPAINQGTNVPVFEDIRGLERTGVYSLGAYHYQ